MLIETLTGHNNWVLYIAFSHNNKYVASGSRDSKIRIWNVEQDKTMHNLYVIREYNAEIDLVMFSSNN